MVDLSIYIRELILQHECIILPDFGGFETSYKSAVVDNKRKKMLPPTKLVIFRPDFKSGGDALLNFLIVKLSIPEERARILISEYVAAIREKLRNGEKVIMTGMGIFIPNPGTDSTFEPFEDENYLADSFGLEPLEISLTNNGSLQKSKTPVKLINNYRSSTIPFVIAGIVIISALLTITFLLSAKFDVQLFNFSSSSKKTDQIIIGGGRSLPQEKTILDKEITEKTSVKKALLYTPSVTDTIVSYCLIAASFKELPEAEKFLKYLTDKNYSCEILSGKEIYRISIGRYKDKLLAMQELERFNKELNRTIWLLTLVEVKQ